jgi:hypothetical protein
LYHEAGDQNWRLLNKAIPYTTLVRMWVVERLKEELGGKEESERRGKPTSYQVELSQAWAS